MFNQSSEQVVTSTCDDLLVPVVHAMDASHPGLYVCHILISTALIIKVPAMIVARRQIKPPCSPSLRVGIKQLNKQKKKE
jgi:hypothetical protein